MAETPGVAERPLEEPSTLQEPPPEPQQVAEKAAGLPPGDRSAPTAAAATPTPAHPCQATELHHFNDADLDAAALKLDDHARALRSDLLGHLLAGKAAAEERWRAELAERAASHATNLAAKQQELDVAAALLARQREVVRRTGDALFRAACWRRQHTLGCMAWRAWREAARRQRRIQAGLVAAARHYDVGRLQLGVFRVWRAQATGQLRLRVKAQAASSLEAEKQHIWQEANAANALQSQRMAQVEAALAAALAARAQLEADMKRAFMRGVCALNIEAMTLLRGGGGSAGCGNSGLGDPTVPPAKQAGADGGSTAADSVGEGQQLQQAQKVLQQEAPWAQAGLSPAEGWAIGARGWEAGGHPPASAAVPAPSSSSNAGLVRSMPAAELPWPLFSVEPRMAVATLPPPPENHHRAERASGSKARPGTAAVPCSLPSNVPAHIAASLVSRGAGAVARPTTAPARRKQPAVAAQGPGQHSQQQQQVSRRSLAGQQRMNGQVLVVRGAVAGTGAAATR